MKRLFLMTPLLLGACLMIGSPLALAQTAETADTGTEDTGTQDTGTETGDTGTTSGGTVTAGPAEEVIHKDPNGRTTDVTDRPNDAFPPGSTVPDQQQSSTAPQSDDSGGQTFELKPVKGKVYRRIF